MRFIFSIFAKDYHFGGATTKTVICGSLLPKANGGGDRGICVRSQRAIPNIFCSVHGDTMTLVFQLFASHAGRQELSAWFFLPARARVNLQKSLSPVSPCHPEAVTSESKLKDLRCKSQSLTMQKSGTYAALSTGLQTPEQRKSMRKYEQPWASMSNYELPPHRLRIFATWFRDTRRSQSRIG